MCVFSGDVDACVRCDRHLTSHCWSLLSSDTNASSVHPSRVRRLSLILSDRPKIILCRKYSWWYITHTHSPIHTTTTTNTHYTPYSKKFISVWEIFIVQHLPSAHGSHDPPTNTINRIIYLRVEKFNLPEVSARKWKCNREPFRNIMEAIQRNLTALLVELERVQQREVVKLTALEQEDDTYQQLIKNIWIGCILALISISFTVCLCSCITYHRFRSWKRSCKFVVKDFGNILWRLLLLLNSA